ncbi:MAG: hypothetical protein ACQERB_00005 [Promethearchaeati archaeon]
MSDNEEKDYKKDDIKRERERLDKMGMKSTFDLLSKPKKEEDD